MQVLVLEHTYNTLDMPYACSLLNLTFSLWPRHTVCVANASCRDLNGTSQRSASYSDSTPWRRRARRAQHTFPPMGAGIDGLFPLGLHAAGHIWVAPYTPGFHLGKAPILVIFLVEHHVPDSQHSPHAVWVPISACPMTACC